MTLRSNIKECSEQTSEISLSWEGKTDGQINLIMDDGDAPGAMLLFEKGALRALRWRSYPGDGVLVPSSISSVSGTSTLLSHCAAKRIWESRQYAARALRSRP